MYVVLPYVSPQKSTSVGQQMGFVPKPHKTFNMFVSDQKMSLVIYDHFKKPTGGEIQKSPKLI